MGLRDLLLVKVVHYKVNVWKPVGLKRFMEYYTKYKNFTFKYKRDF